jgi:hypothetical protein
MAKYIMQDGREFEMDTDKLYIPVLAGQYDRGEEEIKIEDLQKKYPAMHIIERVDHLMSLGSDKVTVRHSFYSKSTMVGLKEYEPVKEYDPDCPPKSMLVEVTLQAYDSKRHLYVDIKNYNCTFMDIMENAVEEIVSNPETYFDSYSEEDECGSIDLYDEGGWHSDIEIYFDRNREEEELKRLVTGIRLVQEVVKEEIKDAKESNKTDDGAETVTEDGRTSSDN